MLDKNNTDVTWHQLNRASDWILQLSDDEVEEIKQLKQKDFFVPMDFEDF
jgi:hypothetical protein